MIIIVSKEHAAETLISINNCYLAMTDKDKAIIHNTPITKKDAEILRFCLYKLYTHGVFHEDTLNGKQKALIEKLLNDNYAIDQYNIEKR